jgi:hypothetical protein
MLSIEVLPTSIFGIDSLGLGKARFCFQSSAMRRLQWFSGALRLQPSPFFRLPRSIGNRSRRQRPLSLFTHSSHAARAIVTLARGNPHR